MGKLRDEHAVWDDVDGIVCELLDVERRLRATPGQRIDAIDRILDAVDRHLASRTAPPPAVPGEPLRNDRPPYICLGCDALYDACPDFDAYNCPACGEKVMPLHLFVSQGRKLHSSSGPLPHTPADPTGAEPGTGKP